EAVEALDYSIYKTGQMVDLVQWLHDYNVAASEDKKVCFYGNDMQRYDYSKKAVLDYYEVVNKDTKKKYANQLENVSNDTMRELTTKQLEEIDHTIDNIISALQSNEGTYVERYSHDAF